MSHPSDTRESRPALTAADGAWALAAALAALALYVATLQPDLGGPEDTPKFQFLGYVLGTAHPPGYPLYVLLSHVFVTLVPVGSIAYRANLFSAVMAAACCAAVYVIARQLGAGRLASWSAAAGLATGASFWRSAVFAEVYSLAAVVAAAATALLIAWGRTRRAAFLIAAIAVFAAGLGNHLTIVGIVPAFVGYVLIRDRRVLSARLVVAAALLLIAGAAQYGFVVLRTHQGAAYLESRAASLAELVDVVTATQYAEQRFAMSVRELLTVQAPVVLDTIAKDLGIAGLVWAVLGLAAIIARRSLEGAMVLAAGTGMLAMVLNLSGDIKGFITPVMVFAWPFAARGITAFAAALSPRVPAVAPVAIAAAAVSMPLVNATRNYAAADQSGQVSTARFFRALVAQLPDDSAVVAEDYFYDSVLKYLRFTGEGDPARRVAEIPFDAGWIPQPPRRTFAFAGAATFFATAGYRFVPAPIVDVPLEQWLGRLPRGVLVVAASAFLPGPIDLSAIGHADARPAGRPQAFEAFAVFAHQPGASWKKDDRAVALVVGADISGAARVPALPIRAAATADGARIEVSGRTVAFASAGIAVAVLDTAGRVIRALEFAADAPRRVPFVEAVYELSGRTACVDVREQEWQDISPALRTGSWVAALERTGTVVLETETLDETSARMQVSGILGDAQTMDLTAGGSADARRTWSSALTRTGSRRSVFRMTTDRPGLHARARLRSGAGTLRVCAHDALPLFEPGATAATLRADFEAEPYFGPGWRGHEPSSTGPVRRGDARATLLLPLEPGATYRMTVDLDTQPGGRVEFRVDAARQVVGTCALEADAPCEVTLQGCGPITALTLVAHVTPPVRLPLVFQGARLRRIQ